MRRPAVQLVVIMTILVLLGLSLPLCAQDASNLKHFQELALQRNPAVHAARHRIEAAKGVKTQAGLYPNPVVGYHANEIGMHDSNGAHGVFVRQMIPASKKRQLEIELAGNQLTQFQFEYSLMQQRIKTDVAIAFGKLLIAQKRLETLGQLQKSTLDSMQSTKQLFESGQSGQHVFLQSQLEYEQAHLQALQAGQDIKTAWYTLRSLCGVEEDQVSRVTGELYKIIEPVSWDFIVDSIILQNPQVALLQYKIEEQKLFLKRQQADNSPDVEFMLSFRHHSLTDDDIANIQIGVPIPIFDDNRGNITAAQARLKSMENELSVLRIKLRVRASEVFRDYENSRLAEQRYRETMLPIAEKNLRLVQTGFESRQLDFLSFLTAQRTFLRINLSYLEASERLIEAVSLLNGQLLKDHLSQ